MKNSLYILGAVCAFFSVITTIGIHSFIKGPATFEESLVMYKTGYYIFSKWWVIFHCLFVIVSVYSLTHYLDRNRSAFAHLGFMFYTLFGVTEIIRMLLVIHYLGPLRDSYLATNDEALRSFLKLSMDNFSGIGNTLFVAFTVFILLGNLFTGLACFASTKLVRYLGAGLLLWCFVLVASLFNQYVSNGSVDTFIGIFSLTFQPFIRLVMAVVLFRVFLSAGKISETVSENAVQTTVPFP